MNRLTPPPAIPTAVAGEPSGWLMRHARTAASRTHHLNGNPQLRAGLDRVGRGQCRTAGRDPVVTGAGVCVVSGFARTQESARRVLGKRAGVPVIVDAGLNELDYGVFEDAPFWEYGRWLTRHGPAARPPGGAESQREGLSRMVAALRQALARPGPVLVIGHGLLVSVLIHVRSGASSSDLVFPEAGYLVPVAFTGADLDALEQDLNLPAGSGRGSRPSRWGCYRSRAPAAGDRSGTGRHHRDRAGAGRTMTSTHLTAAARAIIRHDRKLLLVTDGTGYWYTPGGRMNPTETLPECVAREVHEETGLHVTVGDVLAVSEYLDPDGEHKIECFFAATLTNPPAVFTPWQDTGGPVASFGWFTDTDLAGMDVRPAFLRTTGTDQPGQRAPVYVSANP